MGIITHHRRLKNAISTLTCKGIDPIEVILLKINGLAAQSKYLCPRLQLRFRDVGEKRSRNAGYMSNVSRKK